MQWIRRPYSAPRRMEAPVGSMLLVLGPHCLLVTLVEVVVQQNKLLIAVCFSHPQLVLVGPETAGVLTCLLDITLPRGMAVDRLCQMPARRTSTHSRYHPDTEVMIGEG